MYKIKLDNDAPDAMRSVLTDEELVKFSFNVQFAKCVFDRRTALGWSQQTLAEKSGVNRVTIAKIEKLQRQAGIEVVLKLLEALGLEINFTPVDNK